MIPRSISLPFGRSSPQLSAVDLARVIDRTIALAVAAHHEQGWAAVSMGCDGRKRTTFFDGSSCQTAGEVCLAQRQDGISSCIDTPAQGNGLIVQSITFAAPVCAPVTGWYILDSAGYLYRIPATLLTAVPYWPPAEVGASPGYDLVRSGTWARLMCAAALAPPTLNGEGGSAWSRVSLNTEESVWAQTYSTAVGGTLTHLETIPGLTDGTEQVTVAALDGRWLGAYKSKGTASVVSLLTSDVNTHYLVPGEEYKALIYAYPSGSYGITVDAVKGVAAPAGIAVRPDNPQPTNFLELAISTVAYGGAVTSESIGSVVPINWAALRELRPTFFADQKWAMKGLLVRDADAPNAGVRHVTLTLPSAGTGIVTGDVRVAWGYPLAFEMLDEHLDEGAPFAVYSGSLAGRDDYDMAFVYGPPRIGVEYAPYHLNLAGSDILNPDDSTMLSASTGDEDTSANLLALPNGELAVSQPYSDGGTPTTPPRFDRYRIRPAPDTAPTVALSQEALGTWPDDTNIWAARMDHLCVPWLEDATTVTLDAVNTSSHGYRAAWTHGRPVACILWHYDGYTQKHFSNDAAAKVGVLMQPAGGDCAVTFTVGGAPAPQVGKLPQVTILGPALVVAYGWTETYLDLATGQRFESALSPLTETAILTPSTGTYTLTVTVPVGATGTVERSVYRFAWDRDVGRVGNSLISPWDARSDRIGPVYDRMVSRVKVIENNVDTEWIDDVTALSFSGTRPPSPVILVGSGITFDAPGRPYALPPLNL